MCWHIEEHNPPDLAAEGAQRHARRLDKIPVKVFAYVIAKNYHVAPSGHDREAVEDYSPTKAAVARSCSAEEVLAQMRAVRPKPTVLAAVGST